MLADDARTAGAPRIEPRRPEFAWPSRGDRVELLRPLGVRVRGSVYYADHLQILVKWDDGRSESLRAGAQLFRILGAQPASSH